MKRSQTNINDIYVVGKSAFNPRDSCAICDEIFPRNPHEKCLQKDDNILKSTRNESIHVPYERSAWCLSDYHVDFNPNGYIEPDLKSINQLSQYLNGARYEKYYKNIDNISTNSVDNLAQHFFPITLRKNKEVDDNPPLTLTFSPPSTGIPRPSSPWRVATPHNRAQLHSPWLSTEKHIKDNVLFMHDNPQFQPDEDASLLQTPYQLELSRLRLERLRLEEQILMEVKRQEELERIRGPQPKWYELKDSRFHYEAKKNNNLLRSCKSWQDLYDYRNQLKTKSEEFNKKYYPNKTYDPSIYVSVS